MESDENDRECLDLDDLLPEVGEFGRYQKIMLWLVCLPACFPCGFGAFNQLFMSEIPDHWCYVPELQNYTAEERKFLAIPRTNYSWHSKCQKFLVDWETVLEGFESVFDVPPNNSWSTGNCDSGWEYNTTEISSSIVIDFDLVCDRDIYPTFGLVALNIGGPIGVYCFGILNDRIGRKKSFFLCLTTLILGGVLTATARNFWWWATSRVIVGLTIPAIYQIPFIISLELVGPNYRSFVTVLTCMFYTFGLVLLSGVTYLIRDWVQLAYATSVPFLLYYIYWFFLPESPRWLLARGKFVEASNVLQTLARFNKKDLPASFAYKLKQRISRSVSQESLYRKNPTVESLCATPNMRLKTFLITLNWFANETVYVGLSYYGPSLGDNEYLSFLLSCIVEIPSYFACWLIMDRWGRRWPLCLCMIISGMSCIATVLIPPDDHTTTLILFLVSKSAISASFLIIYPFAGELYPTQLRGIGIGTSAYIGGLGLIVIPFIMYLGSEMLILPLVIMGAVSVIGGLSGLRLPETIHYRLPQTAEEGEMFGKHFTCEDCSRCVPLKPEYPKSCSYEALELQTLREEEEVDSRRKLSMRRLARQSSVMDTQKDVDGTMKLTYWF